MMKIKQWINVEEQKEGEAGIGGNNGKVAMDG